MRGPKGKKQKHDAPEDEDFREYAAAPQAAPEDTADFAMPELSALLGQPVTPEDAEEQPEDADKPTEDDDGRAE